MACTRSMVFLFGIFLITTELLFVNSHLLLQPKVKNFSLLGKSFENGKEVHFYLSSYYVTQSDAIRDCISVFNGALVSIEDSVKNVALTSFIQSQTGVIIDRIHTTGRYHSGENRWEWYGISKPMNFTDWDRFHGEGGEGICCYKTGRFDDFKWHSYPCSDRSLFICQYELPI